MAIRKRINYHKRISRGSSVHWKNKLFNIPCFIIGNGPSASEINYSKLKNYFTIGINKAYLLIDPTILMWQDVEFWTTDRYSIAKKECIKYATRHADPKGKYINFYISGNGFKLPDEANKLHGFGATGPLAFQLAYILGCDPIILIGMDCKYKGIKTNFYGKNNFHTANTLPNCNRGLDWIKKVNSNKTIISCSMNEYFKQNNLEEIIKRNDIHSKQRDRDFFVKKLINR